MKIIFGIDGNQIVSTYGDFECLAISPAGFGCTIAESVANLFEQDGQKKTVVHTKLTNDNLVDFKNILSE